MVAGSRTRFQQCSAILRLINSDSTCFSTAMRSIKRLKKFWNTCRFLMTFKDLIVRKRVHYIKLDEAQFCPPAICSVLGDIKDRCELFFLHLSMRANTDVDTVEYVRSDVPCIHRRIDDILTLNLDLKARESICLRIKGFRNFFLNQLMRQQHLERDFIALVSVLEKAVQVVGDACTSRDCLQAYRSARKCPMMIWLHSIRWLRN